MTKEDEPRTTERPNLRELQSSLKRTKMYFFMIRMKMSLRSSKVIINFHSTKNDKWSMSMFQLIHFLMWTWRTWRLRLVGSLPGHVHRERERALSSYLLSHTLTLQDIYLEKKSHIGENCTCEEGEKEQWCQLYAPQFLEMQTIVYRDFIRSPRRRQKKVTSPICRLG